MTFRDFALVQADLERIVLMLKEARDPKLRRTILLEMRLLLAEADRLVPEILAKCAICGKPIPLEAVKVSEDGKPVHEECYIGKTKNQKH